MCRIDCRTQVVLYGVSGMIDPGTTPFLDASRLEQWMVTYVASYNHNGVPGSMSGTNDTLQNNFPNYMFVLFLDALSFRIEYRHDYAPQQSQSDIYRFYSRDSAEHCDRERDVSAAQIRGSIALFLKCDLIFPN